MKSHLRHKFRQQASATRVFLLAALTGTTLLALHIPANAIENRIDQAIVVRIEGATQGSGVVVKKRGKTYTVLTAWHVISPNNNGEEIEIISNGKSAGKILAQKGTNISRIGEIDLGLIEFESASFLPVARLASDPSEKDIIKVVGFPISSNGKKSSFSGTLIANADVGIDQGYQLLYNAHTEAGMSGGALLNSKGELAGIHGRGEQNIAAKTSKYGKGFKTGVNQGIPISIYKEFSINGTIKQRNKNPKTFSDYYALTVSANRSGHPQTALRLAKMMQRLEPRQAKPYAIESFILDDLGMQDTPERREAKRKYMDLFTKYFSSIKQASNLMFTQPKQALSLAKDAEEIMSQFDIDVDLIKAFAYQELRKPSRVILHTRRVIEMISDTPKDKRISFLMSNNVASKKFHLSAMYLKNASARQELGDHKGAKNMYTGAIFFDDEKGSGSHSSLYFLRADAEIKSGSGDFIEACEDFEVAYSNPKFRIKFPNAGGRYRDTLCPQYPLARQLHNNVAQKLCEIDSKPVPLKKELGTMIAKSIADRAGIPMSTAKGVGIYIADHTNKYCPGKFRY